MGYFVSKDVFDWSLRQKYAANQLISFDKICIDFVHHFIDVGASAIWFWLNLRYTNISVRYPRRSMANI